MFNCPGKGTACKGESTVITSPGLNFILLKLMAVSEDTCHDPNARYDAASMNNICASLTTLMCGNASLTGLVPHISPTVLEKRNTVNICTGILVCFSMCISLPTCTVYVNSSAFGNLKQLSKTLCVLYGFAVQSFVVSSGNASA